MVVLILNAEWLNLHPNVAAINNITYIFLNLMYAKICPHSLFFFLSHQISLFCGEKYKLLYSMFPLSRSDMMNNSSYTFILQSLYIMQQTILILLSEKANISQNQQNWLQIHRKYMYLKVSICV
jgi:hypothetical protein